MSDKNMINLVSQELVMRVTNKTHPLLKSDIVKLKIKKFTEGKNLTDIQLNMVNILIVAKEEVVNTLKATKKVKMTKQVIQDRYWLKYRLNLLDERLQQVVPFERTDEEKEIINKMLENPEVTFNEMTEDEIKLLKEKALK